MELTDVYTNKVQGSQLNSKARFSTPFGSPTFERDPNLIKMESDIFSKLSEIASVNDDTLPFDKKTNLKSTEISFVSYEEALRQLMAEKAK